MFFFCYFFYNKGLSLRLRSEMGKIKIRSPKRGYLENQDQDRDLKIKITSKIT